MTETTPRTKREWLASMTPEERHRAALLAGDLMARKQIRAELARMAAVAAVIGLGVGVLAWLA